MDYSISKVGPGSNSRKVWEFAKKYGNPAAAKVQINASWELSAVPYIPVPDLVEQHLNNLSAAGVSDLMLGWTLGGYPGGNMGLLRCSKESLAGQLYGSVAPTVLKAWQCFRLRLTLSLIHPRSVAIPIFTPRLLKRKPTVSTSCESAKLFTLNPPNSNFAPGSNTRTIFGSLPLLPRCITASGVAYSGRFNASQKTRAPVE